MALPDSLILMAVFGRLAESLAKLNGQLGYRLAAARQELQVDTRPTLPARILHNICRQRQMKWCS